MNIRNISLVEENKNKKGGFKMIKLFKSLCAFVLVFALISSLSAQINKAKYVEKTKYPVLEELQEEVKREKAIEDSITAEIRKRQKEQKEKEKEERKVLRSDLEGVKKPKSPESFESQFHFDPIAQYATGTCWCFCTTSFLESEIYRLTGQKIKLSEMHTVYYEYIEKARRYIRERGDSEFGQGSESNAVFRIMKQYGAVPAEVYTGLVKGDKHNHDRLFEEMKDYLEFCYEKNYWDEETALASIKIILNKYLGKPPTEFEWQGGIITLQEFVSDVLKLNLDDYCDVMSTSSIPFYTQGEFKVPDNWWHDSSYYNIPLDEWYGIIQKALSSGYTITIGGDVSEAGYNGLEDVAFIPDFDIPQSYINQDSREFRFYNRTTTDDHGIHIVGYTTIGKGKDKHDWYLIKDSARSSRLGEFEGYYFYRDDYIKLKMLTFSVHRDVMKDILEKFD